jgi:hypothetical protein
MLTILRILALTFGVLTLVACVEDTKPSGNPSGNADTSSPAQDPAPSPPGGGAATGAMCGGIAGIQCADASDYCHYADGECSSIADAAGTCTKRPEMCTTIYQPVCGCDGKTYGNSCEAAREGVSVAAQGECKPSP